MFHLAFFISIFFVEKSDDYICSSVYGATEANKTAINNSLLILQYGHLICFLSISAAYYISHHDIQSYFNVLLNIFSFFVYILMILWTMENTLITGAQLREFECDEIGSYTMGDAL